MADTTTDPSFTMASGLLTAHCIRLEPGADLVSSLTRAAQKAAKQNPSSLSSPSSAVMVLTAIGSLDYLKLRLANASRDDQTDPFRTWEERLEVVSLVGTFCGADGAKHLHMSVADAQGRVFGGHLVEGTVYTTLELVLGTVQGVEFTRELDEKTGYGELVVKSTSPTDCS